MFAINDNKAWQFLETIQDERQRSAVIAIHAAWLNNSPAVCAADPVDTATPLDMEILYRAAAATFQDWPPSSRRVELSSGGQVINQRQATQRLLAVADDETRLLANLFARHVIDLSSTATCEQDLDYYVELFLKCVGEKSVIGNIANGAISKNSAQLSDPDLW